MGKRAAKSTRPASAGRASPRRTAPESARPAASSEVHRKLVAFDPETWHAVDLLGRENFMTFQELADEAFRDLLRKHGRPVELRDQLKRSAREAGADKPPGRSGS